ncbi:DNA translocase FtsK 4TM domain-containing protein [Kutzneria kofuensis]|uniref:DNA translocase FtsK 4TM domain-containing protein n=1 Tax=Kutzneria kofuensis TaxID=103725 RepID=UPI0031EBCA6C
MRSVIGGAAYVLPLVLLFIGIVLMRSDPLPEARPRIVFGMILLAVAILGLLHLFFGAPELASESGNAGGCGRLVGRAFLAQGLTAGSPCRCSVLLPCTGSCYSPALPSGRCPPAAGPHRPVGHVSARAVGVGSHAD